MFDEKLAYYKDYECEKCGGEEGNGDLPQYEAERLPAGERCGYLNGALLGAERGDNTITEPEFTRKAVLMAVHRKEQGAR